MVLVDLGEDGGDLALSEGVVQGVVNDLRSEAETGGGVAIYDEVSRESVVWSTGLPASASRSAT